MADEVFDALADRTRRSIVEALARAGACTATQIASDLPITRQAVAKHLGHLHRAGLVVAERRGRETDYRLVPDRFGRAIAWLEGVRGEGREAPRAA